MAEAKAALAVAIAALVTANAGAIAGAFMVMLDLSPEESSSTIIVISEPLIKLVLDLEDLMINIPLGKVLPVGLRLDVLA